MTTTQPNAVALTTAALAAATAVLVAEHQYRAGRTRGSRAAITEAENLAVAAVALADRVHDLAEYIATIGEQA